MAAHPYLWGIRMGGWIAAELDLRPERDYTEYGGDEAFRREILEEHIRRQVNAGVAVKVAVAITHNTRPYDDPACRA